MCAFVGPKDGQRMVRRKSDSHNRTEDEKSQKSEPANEQSNSSDGFRNAGVVPQERKKKKHEPNTHTWPTEKQKKKNSNMRMSEKRRVCERKIKITVDEKKSGTREKIFYMHGSFTHNALLAFLDIRFSYLCNPISH